MTDFMEFKTANLRLSTEYVLIAPVTLVSGLLILPYMEHTVQRRTCAVHMEGLPLRNLAAARSISLTRCTWTMSGS